MMTLRISEASVIKRNQTKFVLISAANRSNYVLDAVAVRIWALIEESKAICAIRDAIVTEYDVEPEVCERDVRAFIEGMDAAAIIEEVT